LQGVLLRIAVISDTHLGYAWGTERGDDAMAQAEEAFDIAIKEKADIILLPGDVFDTRIPRPEVWAAALRLMQKPLLAGKSRAKFVKLVGSDKKVSPIAFAGIPVVAIFGTHERRGSHAVNPMQMLEHAGFVVLLHHSGAIFDVEGRKVCIQGLSGVPDNYVKKAIEAWNPSPTAGCSNIFMFHQSLGEYIYSEDENPLIKISDLPKGFDLYIDGHIHWHDGTEGEKRLLFPGSTVITQQKKSEAENRKGIYIIDIGEKLETRFVELPSQRPFYFEELAFEKADPADIVKECRSRIEKILKTKHQKKPMIALKISGSLQEGRSAANIRDDEITHGFDAIVSVRNEIETKDFLKKLERLRQKQQQKMSVDEMGMQIIEKLLEKTEYRGMPPADLIDELADGDTDAVVKRILDRTVKAPEKKAERGAEAKPEAKAALRPAAKAKPGKLTGWF
jgi:DNA repair exonuclease SbcCD nuclease subunit